MTICKERQDILLNCPLIVAGADQYNEKDSIRHISEIIAYNRMNGNKPLKYMHMIKPFKIVTDRSTKKQTNVQVSKFYPLSAEQLKQCAAEADKINTHLINIEKDEYAKEQESIKAHPPTAPKRTQLPDNADVYNAFLDAFHVNSAPIDDDVATMILLSFLGSCEITGDGLHNGITSDAGIGKSITTNAALHGLPQDRFYSGAFSDKALIYDENLKPGMIIKLDEAQGTSEVFEAFLKEAVSSYQNGVTYRTVIDKHTEIKVMPPRLTFVLLSVDGVGDEQTRSRFVPIGLNSRSGITKTITAFRLNKRKNGLAKLHTDDKVLKSRELLKHFSDNLFKATIPFIDNIDYRTTDQRVQEWFECCVMYSAVLNYQSRVHKINDDGVIEVEANKKDFEFVCALSIFQSDEKIKHRLSQPEVELITLLQLHKYGGRDITRSRLVEISGKSDGRISQILNGRQDRQDKKGLLDKIGITEISVSEGSDINDRGVPQSRTNEKAYRIPSILPDVTKGTLQNSVVGWI